MVASGMEVVRAASEQDSRRAREAARALRDGRAVFVGSKREGASRVALPGEVVDLLLDVLDHLARGDAVTLAPLHADLTTQQAAELLNVSRPYLVQLLEQGAIPFRRVGVRRRVRLADVLEYRAREDAAAREALRELARQAQEDRLGY